jgi:hypothetical protein
MNEVKGWVGSARLIPLNKAYPKLPHHDEFRPIAILGGLYKWLEARFIEKLRTYASNTLDRNQVGFVPGMGT